MLGAVIADLFGVSAAIVFVGALTWVSELVVAVRMTESPLRNDTTQRVEDVHLATA